MHDHLQKTTNMPRCAQPRYAQPCYAQPHRTHPRCAQKVGNLRFGVSILALILSLGTSSIAAAQTNLIVDLSDPNVSVDLSVLNDGGLSPKMGAPLTGAPSSTGYGDAAYQEPGKDTPVSTLYIKPSGGFKLPPQTKPIESTFAAVPQPSGPHETVVEDVVAEPVEVAVAPSAPAMPEPIAEPAAPPAIAPVAELAPPAPTPAPSAPSAPVAVTGQAQQTLSAPAPATTEPSAKAPAEDVAALTPPPQVAPPAQVTTSAPENQPMALNAQAQTKPATAPTVEAPVVEAPVVAPPVAALPAPTPTPPKVAEQTIPTAPMPPKAGEVVIPLPPREDAPAEVASLPPATGPLSDGDSLRIVFDAETSKLPQAARDSLLNMATKMQAQENLRLQLLAYAGNADTSASAARRLSLSRALAVRSFLIENGVRSTRIDVRALGNKSTDAITERVDITVVER